MGTLMCTHTHKHTPEVEKEKEKRGIGWWIGVDRV